MELEDGSIVDNLLENIIAMKPEKLDGLPIRAAVNKEYVKKNYTLHDKDEVALIPPVSGG
jgi:molybdopterin converting factor small subunit